jgi:hypothetical protein
MRALYRLRTLERDIVKVEWDGETVWMFTRDIWERGEFVSDTSAASAKR